MTASSKLGPSEALAAITEDALFGLAATPKADIELLRSLAKSRAPVYERVARGGSRVGIDAFSGWGSELCAAIAPLHPPDWMPMADVVAAGLSLEGGARGLRSLFTSKPSEREIERVCRLGAFTMRVLGAVSIADGPLSESEQLSREALLVSMGLPEANSRLLLAEPAMPIGALEVPEEIDAKLIRALVRGAWVAAARDGFDPREEKAVLAIAEKLRSLASETEALRADVVRSLEAHHAVGAATIDALRFLLADDPDEARVLARGLLPLVLAPLYRAESFAALEQKAPVTLARRHKLDREGKALVLSFAWVAALHKNPTLTRRAELIARHETIAADLDATGFGSTARDAIDVFVEGALLSAMSGTS